MQGGPGRFPTTRWSLVLAAGEPETRRPALDTLCAAYWPPVYAFVRRQGNDPETAKDLTQAFFLRLLEKQDLEVARPDLGRFRSFLLTCAKHFLANEWDRAHAQKRGGGEATLSFQFDDAERWFGVEPVDRMTPERMFERRWALTILQRGLLSLRDECERGGKGALFERLKPALTGGREVSYRDISERLGMTEGAVKIAVYRMRRRYQEILRSGIAETVRDPLDIDDEIRHLVSVLQEG